MTKEQIELIRNLSAPTTQNEILRMTFNKLKFWLVVKQFIAVVWNSQ